MKIFIMVLSALTLVQSKATTETTHDLLKRLGFDPVQRSPLNYHTKRVALETNKARYHNDFYNSDTDSRMFLVKLPPHTSYYSQMKPEKFKNEFTPKTNANFRTNGKPGRIYHWNIPVTKKLTHAKKGVVRSANEDSKIYHLKIIPNHVQKYYSPEESHNNNKYKIHKYEARLDIGKPNNKYHRNKFYRFTDAVNTTQNNSQIEQKLSDSFIQNITMHDHRNLYDLSKNKNYLNKKSNVKSANEVSKIKSKNDGPNIYMPAIPKQNSFYKYFTGNGKPKSFYVIEKSKKTIRLHRLL